jgi:hypothetical protein
LEGRFGGASKMEGHLEALLEMDFYTKPPNFGVEAHMEAPAGDALSPSKFIGKSPSHVPHLPSKSDFGPSSAKLGI